MTLQSKNSIFVVNKIIDEGIYDFKDLLIDGRVDFEGPLLHTLSFVNCHFPDGFSFSGVEHLENIVFYKCEFGGGLSFSSVRFKKESDESNIHLNFCKIEILRFYNISARSLDIESCEVGDMTLSLSNVHQFTCRGGRVKECNINSVNGKALTLRFVNLLRELKIYSCKIDSLEFFKIEGDGSVYLRYLTTQHTYTSDSTWHFWESVDVSGEMNIIRNVFKGESNIYGSSVSNGLRRLGSLRFIGNTFEKTFQVRGLHSIFDRVIIDCNDSMSGQLHFNRGTISWLKMIGTNSNGDILFLRSEIGDLQFYGFTNLKSLSFSGCTPLKGGKLVINRSDLGKTKFLDHNFDGYESVSIDHSFLAEIMVVSCIWFDDYRLKVSKESQSRREVYRQLKQAAEKQGDRIQALVFQADELRAFRSESKKVQSWWSNDRWILRLGNSNRFGLSWSVALWWMLGWTVLFFVPMAILASPELCWEPAENWSDFWFTLRIIWWERLHIFFQLLNPAHNPSSFVDKDNVSSRYFLLDSIHRLGAAFLVVQIVSAFRKFIKS